MDTDNPNFFNKILEIIDIFENDDFIFCGDFNLVLNPDMDYDNYSNVNIPMARSRFIEIMEERN